MRPGNHVPETLLAALVVALAVFVTSQASVSRRMTGDEAAGTLVQVSAAARTGADDAPEIAAESDSVREPLLTGRSEGRISKSAEYVLEIPRDAPWTPADMRRRLMQGEAGNYIDALLKARDSVITRWPARVVTPLRVWVGDGGMHEGWDAGFPSVVRQAFEEWSNTGIPVHFTYVRDSAGADVRVRFVSSFAQGISGRTIWSRDSAWWLVGGEIDLSLSHPSGDAVNSSQLRAIALHEIGHLLGLDHVEDPLHIMAPRVRVRELSDGDRATVRAVYSVPAGLARD